jgi:hypothetical protein
MTSRFFSALRDGVVVRRGTFDDEELLRMDLPAPEYILVLDEHLPFPDHEPDYLQQRVAAYPPLSDFADALYWQARGKPDKMAAYLAAVDAVKARYPKP